MGQLYNFVPSTPVFPRCRTSTKRILLRVAASAMQVEPAFYAWEVHNLEVQRQFRRFFACPFEFYPIIYFSRVSLGNTVRNERIGRKEDWIVHETKMNELKKKCIILKDENQSLKKDKEALEDTGKCYYYYSFKPTDL